MAYELDNVLPGEFDPEEEQRRRQQQQQPPADPNAFDPSKVPAGVDLAWAEAFNRTDPGDYHRMAEQFRTRNQPTNGGGGSAPTQAWNAAPAPATPAAQAPDPRRDELFNLLIERARQGTTVGRDNPNVRAQVDPMVAQQERASRNYLDDIAERAGPLANLQGERRLAAERTGQAAGAFESEVIGREISARRDEIQQSLQMWGGLMSTEQQMALQRELAQLEDSTRRMGLDLQRDQMGIMNDQFQRELALREFDLNNTWDYRWSGMDF